MCQGLSHISALGLDFALLEQQRAREESRDDLDDDLESAFLGKPSESAPTTSAPAENQGKKRTRAELLAELQRSRQANPDTNAPQNTMGSTREEEIEALERAKQAGKFKPMGVSSFAPVEKKKKKKKKTIEGQEKTRAKDEGEITKAKPPIPSEKPAAPRDASNKQESTTSPVASSSATQDAESQVKVTPGPPDSKSLAPAPPATLVLPPAPPQSVEEVEDVDPFGDVGEYEPEYGDDSDAEGDETKNASSEAAHSNPAPSSRRNWFNDPELEPVPAPIPTKQPTPPQSPKEARPESHLPTRLEGLTSSAMPSISDYLAMDKDEEAREKKRARKEKNKKKAN